MTAANVSEFPTPEPKPKKKKASVQAREAEAEDGVVTVEVRGVTLKVPVGGKIPLAVIDAYSVGNDFLGTKTLLGEEQWKSLLDAGATMDDLNELGQKMQEATGN